MSVFDVLGSLLAGGAMVIPMIGFPDPRDWAKDMLDAGIEWLVDQFGSSTEKILQDTVTKLLEVKWPGFDEAWYEYLVGNTFGLAYTLLTFSVMVMGLLGMMFRKWIPQAGHALGVTLLLFAMNQGMYMLVVTLDKLSESLTKWAYDFASAGEGGEDWTKDASTLEEVTDLFGAVFAYWASFVLSWIMKLEAYALVYFPYVGLMTLVFCFVTWAWTRGARGGKLIRWTVALLTTSVLGKPMMMATLGLGALIARTLPADPIWIILFQVIAVAVPILLFVLANKAYSSILDGHLNVEVSNDVDINDMPSPEPEHLQQLLDDDHDLSVKLDDEPATVGENRSPGFADMVGEISDNDDLKVDVAATALKGYAVANGQAWAVPLIDHVTENYKNDQDESDTKEG